MSSRILSITLLLLFVCSAYTQHNWRHNFRKFPHPCCTKLFNGNISDAVTKNTYREMPAKPGSACVHAILLKTRQGEVCVDPKSEWVQNLTANMTKV